MAYRVSISELAEDDIDNITEYLCQELLTPQAAERFLNEIDRKKVNLSDNPYIYPLHHDDYLQAEGYRFAVIGNYLMLYYIDEGNKTVYIARVTYGGRDISSLF